MSAKKILTTIIFTIVPKFIKGTFEHPRVVMLMVAGLAGMYMVHLLADDYNTYQSYNNRPGRLFGKRSIPDDIFGLRKNVTPASGRGLDDLVKKEPKFSNHISKLDMILRFDPTGCARRYVCTIATKNQKKLTQSERNVINMVRAISKKDKGTGGSAFRQAMELGKKTRDPESCRTEFPKCLFTVNQMLRLMNTF